MDDASYVTASSFQSNKINALLIACRAFRIWSISRILTTWGYSSNVGC